jgi:hypothetical protein
VKASVKRRDCENGRSLIFIKPTAWHFFVMDRTITPIGSLYLNPHPHRTTTPSPPVSSLTHHHHNNNAHHHHRYHPPPLLHALHLHLHLSDPHSPSPRRRGPPRPFPDPEVRREANQTCKLLTSTTGVSGGGSAGPIDIVMSRNSIVLSAHVETHGDGGTWSIG